MKPGSLHLQLYLESFIKFKAMKEFTRCMKVDKVTVYKNLIVAGEETVNLIFGCQYTHISSPIQLML